jgi:hypothetical protein
LSRSNIKYKLFILSWALAAFWLSAGSLVNFHQWKIWGKPLLPQAVMSKREQELSAKTLDILKHAKDYDPGKMFSPGHSAFIMPFNGSQDLSLVIQFIPGSVFNLRGIPVFPGTPLRGPPLT